MESSLCHADILSELNVSQHTENEESENSETSSTHESEFDSIFDKDFTDDFDSIGEYFFESARLAYKADPDYKNLVLATVIMEASQRQSKKDLKNLLSHRKRAAASPLHYAQKIIKGEDLGMTKAGKVHPFSNTDCDKHGNLRNNSDFNRHYMNDMGATEESHKKRKREYDRVLKFNEPWTDAEQSKLEELLLEFPPEEIESRRWEKISFALGNRTPTQVSSRVQKHFIKLMRAGAPIPGRQPNLNYLTKNYKRRIRGCISSRPIQNNGEDENSRTSFSSSMTTSVEDSWSEDSISDVEDVSSELKFTPEYQELLLVKKALRNKLNSAGCSSDKVP